MEKLKINIPKEDIYKIYSLNSSGEVDKIYVFSRGNIVDVFSEESLDIFKSKNIEIVYSKNQIHKDDSIRVIKKKILLELGANNNSYEELYLFVNILENIDVLKLYQTLTNNEKSSLTKVQLNQVFSNFNITNVNIDDKEIYSYNDFSSYFSTNKDYLINHALGQYFSETENWQFPANPFSSVHNTTFVDFTNNPMLSFENELLLNYKNIHENIIYLCTPEKILQFLLDKGISEEISIQTYFPLLHKSNILSSSQLSKNKKGLLSKNKELLNKQTLQLYKTVDLFYDIYNGKKEDLHYQNKGIKTFDLRIISDLQGSLPLDVIFKNIHATKEIPFIKFNPGSRSENLYRLYSIQQTFDGKNIPYLSESTILRLSRDIGKSKQIAVYTEYISEKNGQTIHLNIIIENTGDVYISSELKIPITIDELKELLISKLNPILININSFLEQTGYSIKLVNTLYESYIEIIDITYVIEYILEKQFNLSKYIGCISSIFDFIREDEVKGTELIFKRVNNFQEMDSQTIMIRNAIIKTGNISTAIQDLMKNYKMTQDAAELRVVKYFSEHKDVRGKVIDNPGFGVLLKITNLDKLVIEISDINALGYIDVLNIYFDSIIRITQKPDTTIVTKAIVTDLCLKSSKIDNKVDASHIENVVATTFIKPTKMLKLKKSDIDEEVDIEDYEIQDNKDVFFEESGEELSNIEPETIIKPEIKPIKPIEVKPIVPIMAKEVKSEDTVSDDGLFFEDEEEEVGEEPEEEEEVGEEVGEEVKEEPEEKISEIPIESSQTPKNETSITSENKNSSVSSSSEEGLFYDDEEDEEDEEGENEEESNIKKGGNGEDDDEGEEEEIEEDEEEAEEENEQFDSTNDDEFVINPVGIRLKDPSYFYTRMKQRDPILFATEEGANYEGYARICQSSRAIQPVILTKKEFDKINKDFPGSYTDYIKYGTNPDNAFYYICPRYWCMKTNTSVTEQDVKDGKCAKVPDPQNPGKFLPDKIIEKDTKFVTNNAFVYEFNNPKEHINKNGEYIKHYPGFKPNKHPKGYGLPCCFKIPKQNWEYNQDGDVAVKKGKTKIAKKTKNEIPDVEKNTAYIISNETFPIKQMHRFGFLPKSVQYFLQTDNNLCVTENNAAMIKENVNCILRYGVEQVQNQSIYGSIAELYAYTQGLENTPSVSELKTIIKKAITIDHFVRYNNSNLVSIFKPKKINREDIDIESYSESKLYKSIKLDNEFQVDFLEDTIASYENYIKYLTNDESMVDHKYIWDMITENNENFIKGGVNLIILDIPNNDITDNIKILCPTNSRFTKLYDSKKASFILIKRENIYEPIYIYRENDGIITATKTFYEINTLDNIRRVLKIVQKTRNMKCGSYPSLPKIYKFAKNIDVRELYIILKSHDYRVLSQVLNYQGKIIGLVVTSGGEDSGNHVFVPCLPSSEIDEMNDIDLVFMDEDDSEHPIWNDYDKTVAELKKINQITGGKIQCYPKMKVIEDELIVGIITNTNQFVKIEPPSENVKFDDLVTLNGSNYIIADKVITTSSEADKERIEMIKKISLESQFYTTFRSLVRTELNLYENTSYRTNILRTISSEKMDYKQKMKRTIDYLKKIMEEKVLFQEIGEDVLLTFEKISCLTSNCGEQEYCIKTDDGKCQMIIPNKHLISGLDNENIYYGRLADELVRYKRIQVFMFQPKTYLNVTNTDYDIREDEFILLQTSINNDYLKKLVPFNYNSQIINVNHSTANPQTSQVYSNDPVPLSEQTVIESSQDIKNINDHMLECIKETVEVVGKQSESMWKRIFPKTTKEIIFKNTSTNCSFYVLLYIFFHKYKTAISIQSLKVSLWNGYKQYLPKYKDAILKIWKNQGKKMLCDKIKSNHLTIETAIMSDAYYITNLDIWIFSLIAKTQICLFSKLKLKTLNENWEWLIMGNKYNDMHYFIRSPVFQGPNKIPAYNLIRDPFAISSLGEFQTIVQNTISGRSVEETGSIQSLESYLENFQ